MARNKEIEEVRNFVVKMITDEQSRHAELINNLRAQLGFGTADDVFNILSRIHEERISLLETIYEKIKSV